MSKLRKSLRTKLRSAFSKLGCCCRSSPRGKDRNVGRSNSLSSKLTVNEEYTEVFRTKSYVEMWDKVHGQLPSTSGTAAGTSTRQQQQQRPSSSSLSIIPNLYMDRSECLLEPRQETLKDMIHQEGLNPHHLVTDYFEASIDACRICDLLLRGIYQTRLDYRKVKKLILKLSRRLLQLQDHHHIMNIDSTQHNNINCSSTTTTTTTTTSPEDDEQCRAIFGELTAFALNKNPLSIISPFQFRDIHDGYLSLFNRLTLKHRKVRRAAKLNRIAKKVGAVGLVVSHSALLIVMLVFVIHSIVGIVVAPALMACSLGLCAKQMESAHKYWLRTRSFPDQSRGGRDQLDVAARGVFTLVNDFDTMSRMVARLHDQVEHRKDVARMCVKSVRRANCGSSSRDIFNKVAREFHATESNLLDQLDVLEEHIYLCLLTINRSRRLVLEEILATE